MPGDIVISQLGENIKIRNFVDDTIRIFNIANERGVGSEIKAAMATNLLVLHDVILENTNYDSILFEMSLLQNVNIVTTSQQIQSLFNLLIKQRNEEILTSNDQIFVSKTLNELKNIIDRRVSGDVLDLRRSTEPMIPSQR